MYWVYQTRIYSWHRQYVQAKLIAPPLDSLIGPDGPSGLRSPMQDEPFGFDLSFTFQINPEHPHPDNYFQNAGFTLYSERLVQLMRSFDVKAEIFPVIMVDEQENPRHDLKYSVFHSLEGVQDAMDEEKSEWLGDLDIGVPRLVLDCRKFEHRPLFLCNHAFVPLMRDDLRQEIRREGITGFEFLQPERYHSGSYGFAPEFGD